MRRFGLLLFGLLCAGVIGVGACQPVPATDAPIPTLADLNALMTETAAAQVFAAQTAALIASPTREPLPPTWTPTAAGDASTSTAAATVEPTTSASTEMIYYLYNAFAIAFITPDGANYGLLPVAQTGQTLSSLIAAPDGQTLAYLAGASGATRELFITDRAGTSVQLTQLGLASIVSPVWRRDGGAIAFFGSRLPDAPYDLYVTNADGSGQRQIASGVTLNPSVLSWNSDGETLYYSDGAIYGVDVATGGITRVVDPGLIGPYISAVHSPTSTDLLFVRFESKLIGTYDGVVLYQMDTSTLSEPLVQGSIGDAQALAWSRSGESLLLYSPTSIRLRDRASNTIREIVSNLGFSPQAAISPDDARVVYVDGGRSATNIPQLYVTTLDGEDAVEISRHDGSVSVATDLVWLP